MSRAAAKASLRLHYLSVSFMVDANSFFQARQPSWEWPNLTSLALTSGLLAPEKSSEAINNMIRAAADAAMMMPELETMEIWNGRKRLAALFKYQSIKRGGRTAVITWRGTWELPLQPDLIQAWEAVIRRHCRWEFYAVTELLDPGL